MTADERRALTVVALLLAMGAAARVARPAAASPGVEGATATLVSESAPRAEAEAAAGREKRSRTPLAPGERIDVNRVPAEELERLPRVGPALAARIVEARTTRGPFRSLAALDSVPGIGPALLAAISPHLSLPAAGTLQRPGPAAETLRLDVNRATAEELQSLPGIGPALSARIVEWRTTNGPFRTPNDLEKVPGIGPKMLERIVGGLTAGP